MLRLDTIQHAFELCQAAEPLICMQVVALYVAGHHAYADRVHLIDLVQCCNLLCDKTQLASLFSTKHVFGYLVEPSNDSDSLALQSVDVEVDLVVLFLSFATHLPGLV